MYDHWSLVQYYLHIGKDPNYDIDITSPTRLRAILLFEYLWTTKFPRTLIKTGHTRPGSEQLDKKNPIAKKGDC